MSSIFIEFWHGSCKGLTLHSYVKYIGSANFSCSGVPSEPMRMRMEESPKLFRSRGDTLEDESRAHVVSRGCGQCQRVARTYIVTKLAKNPAYSYLFSIIITDTLLFFLITKKVSIDRAFCGCVIYLENGPD